MRFFTLLACISIALALATKPIQLGTEQDAKNPSLEAVRRNDIENTDHGFVKVVRSDVQARDVSLEKRLDGIEVPYNNADPQQLVLAGVTVTFIMIGKWVREGGHRVYRYICNGIKFTNPTSVDKIFTVISNGAALVRNQPLPDHMAAQIGAPSGGYGSTVDITVGNSP